MARAMLSGYRDGCAFAGWPGKHDFKYSDDFAFRRLSPDDSTLAFLI